MNETLTFDAGWLARGWLSVAEASSKDKARPALTGLVMPQRWHGTDEVGVNPPPADEDEGEAA